MSRGAGVRGGHLPYGKNLYGACMQHMCTYMSHVCIIYVHICYRISEHTFSFPIYAVTYINISEYICAQKFSIYLTCDIYVNIYVN